MDRIGQNYCPKNVIEDISSLRNKHSWLKTFFFYKVWLQTSLATNLFVVNLLQPTI